jgi:hypothetical protein
MFGYRYYRDKQGRQVAVVMAVDENGNNAFWAELIEDGEVIETWEGYSINLDQWAELKEFKLEKAMRTG